MEPSRREDADVFAYAVGLLLDQRDDEAAQQLATLSVVDPMPLPPFVSTIDGSSGERKSKESVTTSDRATTFARDGWRCRYCHRKVVVPGILEILTTLCPGFKGLLSGHHMPDDQTARAVGRCYPNVDHMQAVSRGGAWRDPNNHVTACTPCNERKKHYLGWTPGPIEKDEWDGLVSAYRPLANRLSEIRAYHLDWFKALKI